MNHWQRLLSWHRPEASDQPLSLERGRIYILPTRHGWMFMLVLLAMLIAAINYQNGLAYLLTFLLASLALVSMLHSFRNLYRLRIRPGHPAPVFAGETAWYPLLLENPRALTRLAIGMQQQGREATPVDVPGNSTAWVRLAVPTERRGPLKPARITLYSLFPLGLFRTWTYLRPATPMMVYPRPDSSRGLPPPQPGGEGQDSGQARGGDDFASLRPYHPGDSLRQVDWKALAREQGLMSKQFGGGEREVLWLQWELAAPLEGEARLSRLTRWVIEADSQTLCYGLSLPGRQVEPARGEAHRRQCLEALALHALPLRQGEAR